MGTSCGDEEDASGDAVARRRGGDVCDGGKGMEESEKLYVWVSYQGSLPAYNNGLDRTRMVSVCTCLVWLRTTSAK